MALESLKEQARANAFANQDEQEEEVQVNRQTLMDLVNRISSITTDVSIVLKKVDNLNKRVNFTSRLQVAAVGATGLLPTDVQQRSPKGATKQSALPPHPFNAPHVLAASDASGGHEREGEKGGGREGVDRGEVNKMGGKGVSFAIAGAAFGKVPSRPSSKEGSMLGGSDHWPARASRTHACLDSVQGIHMQWLPSTVDVRATATEAQHSGGISSVSTQPLTIRAPHDKTEARNGGVSRPFASCHTQHAHNTQHTPLS